MKALNDWLQLFKTQLEPLYGEREAKAVAKFYLSESLGLISTDFILRSSEPFDLPSASAHLEQLKAGRPVQHVVGKASFFDLDLRVTSKTLVPRPETEELVAAIARRWRGKEVRILDLGTGSGCIALALKAQLTQAEVWAWELDAGALEVARENGLTTGLDVHFEQHDMLGDDPWPPCEVVVSNPPYIPQKERANMDKNVTDYEPGLALFVPDDDPLLFYRVLAQKAQQHFVHGGELWVEIHEDFGEVTLELLRAHGANETVCYQDLQGKDRYIAALYGNQRGN